MENVMSAGDSTGVKGKVPPPPVLVCRTHNTLVFKPAPFEPETGEKVNKHYVHCLSAKLFTIVFILANIFNLNLVSLCVNVHLLYYKQVVWYRAFARNASGSNVRVRLNDNRIDGTGLWVSVL